MSAIRIAINGFGRIGRQCLRFALASKQIEVVGVHDLSSAKVSAHLFKYDSVHPSFPGKVESKEDVLLIDGQAIPFFSGLDISALPWKKLKVDLVLECTGRFSTKALAQQHVKQGAPRVLVSAPCSGGDVTLVLGVNEHLFQPQHTIVSNASCTTNCVSMLLKVLREGVGLQKALMTTVHAYTYDQHLLDNAHKDLRRARAASISIVPTTSGATRSVVEIFPDLAGRFEGLSVRVPTPDVSLVDLVAEVNQSITVEQLNDLFKKASQTTLKKYLGVSDEPLVSVDYIGDQRSAIVDLELTQVMDRNWIKVIAWYDNEIGFSKRMIDLVEYIYEHQN